MVVKWFPGGVTADFGALKSGSRGDAIGGADLRVENSDRQEVRTLIVQATYCKTPFDIRYTSHEASSYIIPNILLIPKT